MIIVLGTFFVISGILYITQLIHPALRFVLETFFIYQILATKSLRRESMKVYARLKEGDLAGARKEISYLVGRDTQELDESEVAKADVETIAEIPRTASLRLCSSSPSAARRWVLHTRRSTLWIPWWPTATKN